MLALQVNGLSSHRDLARTRTVFPKSNIKKPRKVASQKVKKGVDLLSGYVNTSHVSTGSRQRLMARLPSGKRQRTLGEVDKRLVVDDLCCPRRVAVVVEQVGVIQ